MNQRAVDDNYFFIYYPKILLLLLLDIASLHATCVVEAYYTYTHGKNKQHK